MISPSSQRLRCVLAALLAVVVWGAPACGQILIERNLTVEDGLIHPEVYAFRQDREGFVWIGTGAGISRFDGVAFTSYEEAEGVPPGRVLTLYETPDGTLLAGGDGGVVAFGGERFHPLPGAPGWLAGALVVILAGLPDGTLFAGGSMGLAVRRPDGRWELLMDGKASPAGGGSLVIDVLPARDGTLYAATYGSGAFTFREGRTRRLSLEGHGLSPVINALGQGSDGSVLIGTAQGLGVLRGGSLTVPAATRGIGIRSVSEGAKGVLYLGTQDAGVLRLSLASLEPAGPALDVRRGLADDEVAAVLALPEGPVLIATPQGIGIFRDSAVETWTQEHGLPSGAIQGLAEDARGDVYAATASGLAVHREGRWRVLGRREGFPAESIVSVHAGASGRLYLGGTHGRIWIYEGGSLKEAVDVPAEQPGVLLINGLLEMPGGLLYAATGEGLARVQDGRVRPFGKRDGFPADFAFGLAPAPGGTLYLATDKGLVSFRRGVFRLWSRRDGLPDGFAWAVGVGKDGAVRVGTRRGLAVLRQGRFQAYRDGLSSGVVTCIADGGEGRLLLGTARGVDLLDLRSPLKALPVHGLGRRPVNPGGCLRDRRGRFWFALHSSVSVYDPARELPRKPPRIVLAGHWLLGRGTWTLAPGSSVSFPADRNELEFSFTGVDAAAHAMSFRYRLRNFDPDWTATVERSARYTRLPPGRYRFEVQARNDAGLWSETAGLDLTVLPPPWWRRPALVLSLAAAGLVVGAALAAAFRVRQLLAVERLRTAIAADLHDQIGSGLTEVSVLSEVAGRKAGGLPELERVADVSRELVDRMGDVIWLVNPRRDSLEDLFLRLKDTFAELFACRGASFEMGDLSPLAGLKLGMEHRQHLYLLFREALHNALKHSRCRRVELALCRDGRRFAAVLRDDGRGFDPAHPESEGEGLTSMYRRAGRLGGRLTIESSPAGTTVRFEGTMPR